MDQDLMCPITQQFYEDPVRLTETSQVYSRQALKDWWAQQEGEGIPYTDPVTGLKLSSCDFTPDHAMNSRVQAEKARRSPLDGVSYPALQARGGQLTLQDVLDELGSEAVADPAARQRSSHVLWQLQALTRDPANRNQVMHRPGLPRMLVGLLAAEPLCQELAAGTVRRLAWRSPESAAHFAGLDVVGPLVGMLYSPQDTVREQAALTLGVLGWNDSGARAACLHQLCLQSHSGSALQPFALLLRPQAELAAGKAALAGAEAAAGCLAMLLAAGLPSQVPSAFDASGHKDAIWSLVAVAKVGSAAGKFAAAQTLAALAGLRGNRATVVEGLLGLLYVDTAKPEDRALAAWLLWELCCVQAIAVHICAILLQHPWLQPALQGALATAEPAMHSEGPAWLLARTSVGLVQVLLAESRGATHTNLDPLRLFLANETPLVSILWNLLSADPGSQLVAAYAAANLSAYRSGACGTCDGWAPGSHRQTSGEHRRQSSAGGMERGSPKRSSTTRLRSGGSGDKGFLSEAKAVLWGSGGHQPPPSASCEHNPRWQLTSLAGRSIPGQQFHVLMHQQPAADVLAALGMALHNMCASDDSIQPVRQAAKAFYNGQHAVDSHLMGVIEQMQGTDGIAAEAFRTLLQALKPKWTPPASFSFFTGCTCPPQRPATYPDP